MTTSYVHASAKLDQLREHVVELSAKLDYERDYSHSLARLVNVAEDRVAAARAALQQLQVLYDGLVDENEQMRCRLGELVRRGDQ